MYFLEILALESCHLTIWKWQRISCALLCLMLMCLIGSLACIILTLGIHFRFLHSFLFYSLIIPQQPNIFKIRLLWTHYLIGGSDGKRLNWVAKWLWLATSWRKEMLRNNIWFYRNVGRWYSCFTSRCFLFYDSSKGKCISFWEGGHQRGIGGIEGESVVYDGYTM